MKIRYKGGNAKSPTLGTLLRGRILEVNNALANQLLANSVDWEIVAENKEIVEEKKEFKKYRREVKKIIEDKKEGDEIIEDFGLNILKEDKKEDE